MPPFDATTRSTKPVLANSSRRPRPRFNGYYLIEAGNGALSSVGFFDTEAHAEESTHVASNWEREEKLETALPNPPKITNGKVLVRKTRELVAV